MRALQSSLFIALAISGTVFSATPAGAIKIIVRPDTSFSTSANGASALYSIRKAANYWNTILSGSNNMQTINIAVSFEKLAYGSLGITYNNYTTVTAQSVYQALAANGATALDASAVASLVPLSAAGGLGVFRPATSDGALTGPGMKKPVEGVFDNNDTLNNTYLYTGTAGLKALGFDIGNDTVDSRIKFSSSAYSFDYDPSNGLSYRLDFTATALHEIGHALGFESSTDPYDVIVSDNPALFGYQGENLDDYPITRVFDLFRRDATSPDQIELTPGKDAFFSIDGATVFEGNGRTALRPTGTFNGDGYQASHWKQGNSGYGCGVAEEIGVMAPAANFCKMGAVTANDLAAFDAMGYNLDFDILQNKDYLFTTADVFRLDGLAAVPEPTTWAMMILGFGFIGGAMRTRARKTAVRFAA